MSLTKVSFSMIQGAYVSVLDYGATGDGVTDDTAALAAAFATGKCVYFPEGTYVNKQRQDITTSDISIAFAGNAKIDHQADVICIYVNGCTNVQFENLQIYTAGYGPNSSGLVQVVGCTDVDFLNLRITSDNAAAITRQRVYDGISFSSGSTRCSVTDGVIDGVAKTGFYPATGSTDISFVNCVSSNNANYDPGTYGYSIGFGGTGLRSRFVNCLARNTQGFGYAFYAEINATYNDPNAYGTTLSNCVAYETNGGYYLGAYANNIQTSHISFDNCSSLYSDSHGWWIPVGANVKLNNCRVSNCQRNAYKYGPSTSSAVVSVQNTASLAENFNLVDADLPAHDISGTTTTVVIDNAVVSHDGVGVTFSNLHAFGTAISSSDVANLTIRNFNLQGVLTSASIWYWLSNVTAGYFNFYQAGVPSVASQAPNGSLCSRTDGASTNDNLYVKRGGAWVGIA